MHRSTKHRVVGGKLVQQITETIWEVIIGVGIHAFIVKVSFNVGANIANFHKFGHIQYIEASQIFNFFYPTREYQKTFGGVASPVSGFSTSLSLGLEH